jgi:excisionase family DNA binding protein
MLSDTMEQAIKKLPAILSVREAAEFFQVALLTVYRLIYRKELTAYKDDSGNWCVYRGELKKSCSKNCNL